MTPKLSTVGDCADSARCLLSGRIAAVATERRFVRFRTTLNYFSSGSALPATAESIAPERPATKPRVLLGTTLLVDMQNS